MLEKQQKRNRRHRRVRSKVFGTVSRPRLCVFRSARHIYAQLIDDEKGKTLVSANNSELPSQKTSNVKKVKKEFTKKTAEAYRVGELIAKKALEKKIKEVVFDKAGYKYHGRVKALAEGAREGGLQF